MDDLGILKEEKKFYWKLYSSRKIDHKLLEKTLGNLQHPVIPKDKQALLIEPITVEEIKKIIFESENNKSPGSDGFTNEFYKTFWPNIKDHLINAYNEALSRGYLGTTQREGVITLIPKPQKDLEYIKKLEAYNIAKPRLQVLGKSIGRQMQKGFTRTDKL